MRSHLLPAAALLALVPASAHAAGDPIMPLSQVKGGMHCTGYSVVRGTDIASFAVDVIDVVANDKGAGQPYILFKASGPAIDATGIGPGFSGSPIYCPDGADPPVQRVIGAISEGIGEYGNKTALATPIESVLGEPVTPPAETRRSPATLRHAHPLATPLSFGGLSPKVADLVSRAAAKAKRVVYTTPGAPRQTSFGVQTLRPGSAMAVGLSSGDFTAGAIGTVAYVDGPSVWAFGHPLDSAGRRNLFLQDAYVYDVINNPLASGDLSTYKYAAPGHDVGVLSNDGVGAVVGTLGQMPASFPFKVTATDLDSGKVRSASMKIADEAGVGLPTGIGSLTQLGAIAITQMAYVTLGGLPLRQSGSMCVRITVSELKKPMRFCNTYVGGNGGGGDEGGGGPMVSDFVAATSELDYFNFGPLHITGAEVNIKLRRSLRLAYLLNITKAPAIMRRGRTYDVTVRIQRQNGPKATRTLKVRVPRGMPTGERALTLSGTSADAGPTSAVDALSAILDLTDAFSGEGDTDEAGTRTVKGVAKKVSEVHREDGVSAAFAPPGAPSAADLADEDTQAETGPEAIAQKPREVLRDKELRIAGSAKRRVLIVP